MMGSLRLRHCDRQGRSCMDFYAILDQVVALLRQRQRITYQALKRQFALDDDYIQDLTEALLYAHAPVIVEEGRGLVWRGDAPASPAGVLGSPEAERRFHALLPGMIALLQQE